MAQFIFLASGLPARPACFIFCTAVKTQLPRLEIATPGKHGTGHGGKPYHYIGTAQSRQSFRRLVRSGFLTDEFLSDSIARFCTAGQLTIHGRGTCGRFLFPTVNLSATTGNFRRVVGRPFYFIANTLFSSAKPTSKMRITGNNISPPPGLFILSVSGRCFGRFSTE